MKVQCSWQASFDQYMDDKHRVLGAVFSGDKGTTKQINEVLAQVSFSDQLFHKYPLKKT